MTHAGRLQNLELVLPLQTLCQACRDRLEGGAGGTFPAKAPSASPEPGRTATVLAVPRPGVASGSQSVALGPGTLGSPVNILKFRIPGPSPNLLNQTPRGGGPFRFEIHWSHTRGVAGLSSTAVQVRARADCRDVSPAGSVTEGMRHRNPPFGERRPSHSVDSAGSGQSAETCRMRGPSERSRGCAVERAWVCSAAWSEDIPRHGWATHMGGSQVSWGGVAPGRNMNMWRGMRECPSCVSNTVPSIMRLHQEGQWFLGAQRARLQESTGHDEIHFLTGCWSGSISFPLTRGTTRSARQPARVIALRTVRVPSGRCREYAGYPRPPSCAT